MKQSPWFWPALGIGTAAVAVVAPYLILRFSPSPVEVTIVVLFILLATLATLGFLASKRGHAATFVAIALVLPYLLFGTIAFAGAERASSEVGSFFEEDSGSEDDFLEDPEFFEDDSLEDPDLSEEDSLEGDGTYGSDPALDALWDKCEAGDGDACSNLYLESPAGSEYESFAEMNGGGFIE